MTHIEQEATIYAADNAPSPIMEYAYREAFIKARGVPDDSVIEGIKKKFFSSSSHRSILEGTRPVKDYPISVRIPDPTQNLKIDATEIAREAFNAAREEEFVNRFGKWKYPTFEDYLKSKEK